jgi:uncharacterized protein YbjT (DUF2867 family)
VSCCRELLAAGFKVRAAARDVEQAEANTDIAVQFGLIAPDQLSRLTWVQMDLDEPDSIRPAIGGATKVCVVVVTLVGGFQYALGVIGYLRMGGVLVLVG